MQESELCSVKELQSLVKNKSVRVLDGSWYLPTQNRDVKAEFELQHIPGAEFFDIDAVCDTQSELPHMLPSSAEFSDAVSALGIRNSDPVVVYDSAGLFSAARVWWMFKVFGHDSIRVLDGGLTAWQNAGGETHSKSSKPKPSEFLAQLNAELVASKNHLMENCSSAEYLVLDARPRARFLGQAPEPRQGLPSGHMPRSVSLPVSELVENGELKSSTQLQAIFSKLEIDQASRIITSCGTGVTAAIITLALCESGLGLHKLYDGAWAEWGASEDTTILANIAT